MGMGSNIELMILDWIQNIRTPAGDAVMCFITKLGNAGMIWIVLAVILLLIPKTRKPRKGIPLWPSGQGKRKPRKGIPLWPFGPDTRKTGMVMMAALCIELVVCNGILKNLFARIRPCDVNTQIQLLIADRMIFLSRQDIRRLLLQRWQRFTFQGKENCGNRH